MDENKPKQILIARGFLTIDETAKYFRVCRNTILTQIHKGNIKASKVGRQWRVPLKALQDIQEGLFK